MTAAPAIGTLVPGPGYGSKNPAEWLEVEVTREHLLTAAQAYLSEGVRPGGQQYAVACPNGQFTNVPIGWPWSAWEWTPSTDPTENLATAAACITAAIASPTNPEKGQ